MEKKNLAGRTGWSGQLSGAQTLTKQKKKAMEIKSYDGITERTCMTAQSVKHSKDQKISVMAHFFALKGPLKNDTSTLNFVTSDVQNLEYCKGGH